MDIADQAVLAGGTQKGHSAQRGRAEGVRPPDGATSRDPFATGGGGGRAGRIRLAGLASSPRARRQPQRVSARLGLGQLSRRPPCRTQQDAAAAAAYYRAALRADPRNTELLDRAFLAVLAERRGRGSGQARRARPASRQDRSHRAAGARRARHQAEAIRGRAPAARAIRARPDHRSRRDAAVGLDACRPDRERRRRSRRSTSSPAPTGTRSSRICMPA